MRIDTRTVLSTEPSPDQPETGTTQKPVTGSGTGAAPSNVRLIGYSRLRREPVSSASDEELARAIRVQLLDLAALVGELERRVNRR